MEKKRKPETVLMESIPSEWSTGGQRIRMSGPGLRQSGTMEGISAEALSSVTGTFSLLLTVFLSKTSHYHKYYNNS